jgi:hypothetical protein
MESRRFWCSRWSQRHSATSATSKSPPVPPAASPHPARVTSHQESRHRVITLQPHHTWTEVEKWPGVTAPHVPHDGYPLRQILSPHPAIPVIGGRATDRFEEHLGGIVRDHHTLGSGGQRRPGRQGRTRAKLQHCPARGEPKRRFALPGTVDRRLGQEWPYLPRTSSECAATKPASRLHPFQTLPRVHKHFSTKPHA